jgi:micrococcal nuclease
MAQKISKANYFAALLLSLTMVAGCGEQASQSSGTSNATVNPTPQIKATSTSTVTPKQSSSEEKASAPIRIAAKLTRVIDGDTMAILIDNKKETIRLLLVDTPETVHPDKPKQPFGAEASAFAKETLTGKDVEIEIDVSERDKYGRLLCYLWIGDKMFNEMLLEKGLARVAYIIPPNVKYIDPFRAVQKTAQKDGIGIWSIENYTQEDGFHDELANKSTSVQTPSPKPSTDPKKEV